MVRLFLFDLIAVVVFMRIHNDFVRRMRGAQSHWIWLLHLTCAAIALFCGGHWLSMAWRDWPWW